MDAQIKTNIVNAAISYCSSNNISQDKLAELADIPTAYVNSILQGKTHHDAGKNKPVNINDKYFKALAEAVAYSYVKQYWQPVETIQYLQIMNALINAKNASRTAMIIGGTGSGKTFTSEIFNIKFPKHTYRITVSSLYTLPDIINEICEKLGLKISGSRAARINRIADKLKDIHRSGGNPIIILDEAENMTVPVIKMVKGLYDKIDKYCAIVMIGTPQLTAKLEKLKKRDSDGIPQFCRRVKAGTVHIAEINKTDMVEAFIKPYVQDKKVIDILNDYCDNYGELRDYLEPALREADENGQTLNAELFCLLFNLTNHLAA